MPQLAANATVALGPYAHGAVLNITAPRTDAIASFPTLILGARTQSLPLSNPPKAVTLSQENAYSLRAGNVGITYNVQT
jgi:hypothetical protein